MNRADRRRQARMKADEPNQLYSQLPRFVKQHQENMASILVTSALSVLAEDFGFSPEELDEFNQKLQKKAIGMTQTPGGG